MADTLVEGAVSSLTIRFDGLWGPYEISPSTAVIIFIDDNQDMSFARTIDGGINWSKTDIRVGTARHIAVWFDQETPGDAGTLVHIAWVDSIDNIAYYQTLDISDGSLGTIRTVDSGITVSTTGNASKISVTKTIGGNILYAFQTQDEIECYKSSDNFATAGTDIADVFETATEEDWVMMYPANTADNNDAAAIYWDRSVDEISVKMYDDSENTWTETSISGSMIYHFFYKNMDASVRHSDNHILLAAHTDHDSAGDDLKTWDITVDSIAAPTITAKTNIFTDQAESAQVAMKINQQNNDVYVAHLKGGTWEATVDVVYHKSTDGMGAWGSELPYSEAAADDIRLVHGGRTIGSGGGRIQFSFYNDDLIDIFVNLVNDVEIPAAAVGGRIMSSLARDGGLAGHGGIAGQGGGLAG